MSEPGEKSRNDRRKTQRMSARRLFTIVIVLGFAAFLFTGLSLRTIARFDVGNAGVIVRLEIPPGTGPLMLRDRGVRFKLMVDDEARVRYALVRPDGVFLTGSGWKPSGGRLERLDVLGSRLYSGPVRVEGVSLDGRVAAGVNIMQESAVSALFDLLASPPDTSLASLKEDGAADMAEAALNLTGASGGRLFTWVADWKDAEDYSFVTAWGNVLVAGERKGGRTRLTGFREARTAERTDVFTVRTGEKVVVLVEKTSFELPAKRGAGLKCGFLGVAHGVKVESFGLFSSADRPAEFRDSFMRATAAGIWKAESGRWEIFGMQKPEDSSNPFSLAFSSVEPPPFLHLHERGKGEKVGLGIRLLRDRATGELQVTQVLEDSPADRAGFRRNDRIAAVAGKDAKEYSLSELREVFGRESGKPVKITVRRGGEEITLEVNPGAVDYALKRYVPERHYLGDAELERRGVITAGERFWRDYEFAVTLKPYGDGMVGMLFRFLDERNHLLLRWNGDRPERGSANRLELAAVVNGEERLLAGAAGGFLPGHYYRLSVRCRGARVEVKIDGHRMLEADGVPLPCGKIGLTAEGVPGAIFDDVLVTDVRRPPSEGERASRPVFRRKFVNDRIMKEWADVRNDWKPVKPFKPDPGWGKAAERLKAVVKPKSRTPFFVNSYRYFGDVSLSIEGAPAAPFAAGIGADLEGGRPGCVLLSDGKGGLELTGAGGVAVSTVCGGGRPPEDLRFRLEGNRFVVRDGKRVLLSAVAPEGFRSGGEVWLLGLAPGLPKAQEQQEQKEPKKAGKVPREEQKEPKKKGKVPHAAVWASSPSTFEYTFDSAPCDWDTAEGEWGVMNRWVCTPDWSYFGGRSNYLAAIWNKKTFGGDLNLDFFAGFAMPSYVRMPAEKPAEIGITLYGDGRNVLSGFGLLLAHELNSYSLYFVNGEKKRFAARLGTSPDSFNMGFHQGWVRVSVVVRGRKVTLRIAPGSGSGEGEIEIKGRRIRVAPGGECRFSFTLPEGFRRKGKVGLWMLDNSYLIARAHISAEEVEEGMPALKTFRAGRIGPFDNAAGRGLSCVVEREGTWKGQEAFSVRPLYGGGPNEVFLARRKMDIAATPVLEFAYRAEGLPAWDFCFEYKGRRCKVGLFGDFCMEEETQYLGRFETTDLGDGWRLARADLAAMLRAVFPGEEAREITSPRFAVYYDTDLVQAGWQRNRTCDRMLVAGLVFRPRKAEERTVSVSGVEAVWGRKGFAVVLKGRFPERMTPVIEADGRRLEPAGKVMLLEGDTLVAPVRWPFPLGKEVELKVATAEGERLFSGRAALRTVEGVKAAPRMEFDWSGLPPERRPLEFDFESEWRCTESYDKEGRWRMGFQRPSVATDLARVRMEDPTLGHSLRVMCTDLAQVFGVSFPVHDLATRRPFVECLLRTPSRIGKGGLSLLVHFQSAMKAETKGRWGEWDNPERHKPSWKWERVLWDMREKPGLVPEKCLSVDIGDFNSYRGHYDGTYFLLDEVRFLPPLAGPELPAVVLSSPKGISKAAVRVYAAGGSGGKRRGKRIFTAEREGNGGCSVRFELPVEKLKGYEGKMVVMFVMMDPSGGRDELARVVHIDERPPAFVEGRYRLHEGKRMLWLSMDFGEPGGLLTERAALLFDGERIAKEDILSFSTVRGRLSLKLSEKYYERVKREGGGTLVIEGLADSYGNVADRTALRIGGAALGDLEPAD